MAEKKFVLSAHDGKFFQTADSTGVYFERILEHPVDRVWAALTEPAHLAHWLAPTEIKRGKGGTITLRLTGGVMGGTITEWRENVVLEYAWYNGSTVRWELLSEGKNRTRLLFTHCHVSPRQMVDASKGWHYHLDLLALELDGAPMPHNPVEFWDEITREATARYNAAVAVVAPEPEPLVLERVFDSPPERVWQALTGKEEIGHWFMTVDDFKPRQDYEFTLVAEHNDKRYIHLCRVTEVVDRQRLSYSFRFQNHLGITYVTWELFKEGKKTRVKLTHRGLERIAHAGPEYARNNFVQGWNIFLGERLVSWLQQMPVVTAR
ncbi:MAG TPA: SRPBCC domain-containing protein [Puia sp.]|nr:SRPBCC domain-containing protein [Puia sp.]